MNHLLQNYEIILKTLAEFPINHTPFLQIRRPIHSNMQCIALGLTAEFMSIDSENQLFTMIEDTILEHKIDRSLLNRRRKMLFSLTEQVCQHVAKELNGSERFLVEDSMLLEVCKMCRTLNSLQRGFRNLPIQQILYFVEPLVLRLQDILEHFCQ